MQEGPSKRDWNELQFLSREEFRQAVPSIIRLEITRLGGLIESLPGETDFRNSLVRARFALEQLVAGVDREDPAGLQATCGKHLGVAIMSVSFQPADLDARTRETCSYILDRLNHVHSRIGLLY